MTPLTTYTCGIKTASEGECSDTTYNTHVALKLRHHLQHTHVVLKLQVKGSAATQHTHVAVKLSGGECTDTTYTNTHTHVASTAKECAVIALYVILTASTAIQL